MLQDSFLRDQYDEAVKKPCWIKEDKFPARNLVYKLMHIYRAASIRVSWILGFPESDRTNAIIALRVLGDTNVKIDAGDNYEKKDNDSDGNELLMDELP
jgi:hypothetical protein